MNQAAPLTERERVRTTGQGGYHESRFVFDPAREIVWREVSSYLQQRFIPPSSRVLELGAAYCHFINNVQATERHALDLFEGVAEHAAAGVQVHVRSCTSLAPFGAGSLDCVFASNLFEHLERSERERTISEVKRVLVPGGRVIVVQPNFRYCYREYFDDYTHVAVFTHVGLSDFLRAHGFEIEEVQPRFLPFSMKSRVPKSALLVRAYLNSPVRPLAKQMLVVGRASP